MLFRKTLPFAAAAVAVVSFSAFAQNYPGMADQMAPGGEWVGTPNYGASSTAVTKKKTCFADFDTDGDGGLSTSELDPNSQLYKRFSTRDANGDGKLTRDEYAFIC